MIGNLWFLLTVLLPDLLGFESEHLLFYFWITFLWIPLWSRSTFRRVFEHLQRRRIWSVRMAKELANLRAIVKWFYGFDWHFFISVAYIIKIPFISQSSVDSKSLKFAYLTHSYHFSWSLLNWWLISLVFSADWIAIMHFLGRSLTARCN